MVSAPGTMQSRSSDSFKMLLLFPAALVPAEAWKKSSSQETSQRLLFMLQWKCQDTLLGYVPENIT